MARKLLGVSVAAVTVAAVLLTLGTGVAVAQVVASATGSGHFQVSGDLLRRPLPRWELHCVSGNRQRSRQELASRFDLVNLFLPGGVPQSGLHGVRDLCHHPDCGRKCNGPLAQLQSPIRRPPSNWGAVLSIWAPSTSTYC